MSHRSVLGTGRMGNFEKGSRIDMGHFISEVREAERRLELKSILGQMGKESDLHMCDGQVTGTGIET